MPKHDRTMPAGPLQQWLTQKGRGSKSALATKLKLENQAVLTNWLSRGIPLHRFHDVCEAIGITENRYRAEAGLNVRGKVQGELDTTELLSHFEALPVGLRAYIVRKARLLREIWDSNPILHAVFTPPKDVTRYREWEREIEALILKLKPDAE